MLKTIKITSQILSLFSMDKEEISLREVSKILSIYPSRAHRFLSSLVDCGFLEKRVNRKYGLGEAVFEIGMLYLNNLNLRKIVRPHAEELARMFNTNVHLAIPSIKNPYSAIIIDRVINLESSSDIVQRISYNVPLHCTALGKSILAFGDPKKIEAFKNLKFTKFTNKTIITFENLQKEIKKIKKCGYSLDQGEFRENLYCIGVPIFKNERFIGAISLSDGKELIAKECAKKIIEILKQRAIFISRQL